MASSRAQQAAIAISKKANKKPKMKYGGANDTPIVNVAMKALKSGTTSAAKALANSTSKKTTSNSFSSSVSPNQAKKRTESILKNQDNIKAKQDSKNTKSDIAYYKSQIEHLKKVEAANPNSKKITGLKNQYINDLKKLENKKKGGPVKMAKGGSTPAWTRKEGKNPEGGLNAKGVASYRRANPGSKLQTAVTTKPSKLDPDSKAAKRRKSFCSRMSGMKKKLTSAKTANDPNSRINKSLRKWNC